MSQNVWITRHGNRHDFVNPEWFNTAEHPYDPPLSEDGVIQAQELGERLSLEGIAHIFSSPFLRAVQTAHYVAQALELPIKLEAGLSEWLNPEWMPAMPATLPPEVLAERYPHIDLSYTSRIVPQYPESSETLAERTAGTARQLVEEFSQDILLVGHGASVLGTTTGLVGGSPTINASLCCLVKLVRGSQGWEMELHGDTSHLSQSETVVRFI
ncbi:MAG: histidine phosphatase family protein [Cyanobacteria bacterium QS_6_48_18]|nr:MAG: histidine phosphatase family protein [Cyanobacteria bacterium QS_5_48_63]PSO89295.1 MAG: histidine phosphatase family protein [Cyanobacteria bacterium QS_3_48_167]PSO92178.1 MAG: histidine phosphatase family protein [Cyanobacteria bacterium QS_6_48_18]